MFFLELIALGAWQRLRIQHAGYGYMWDKRVPYICLGRHEYTDYRKKRIEYTIMLGKKGMVKPVPAYSTAINVQHMYV